MTTEWQRVAREVRTRRLALNLTQAQAARSGGVSVAVWNAIENARQDSYNELKLARVCRALGWTPNSIDLIRKGKDPVPDRPASPPGAIPLPDLDGLGPQEMLALVEEIARRLRLQGGEEVGSA